mgnify:CR=1 FL=1
MDEDIERLRAEVTKLGEMNMVLTKANARLQATMETIAAMSSHAVGGVLRRKKGTQGE